MINLNPFAISGLLIVATYLPLFIFIITKGTTKLARVFNLYMLSVCLWGLGAFFIGIASNKDVAILVWKLAYSAVLMIPATFLHSVVLLTKEKSQALLLIVYGLSVYFIAAIFAGRMMNDVTLMFNSFYYHTGTRTYFYSFVFWVALITLGHTKLLLYYKRCFPNERDQILALIVSDIGFLAAIMNFLPGFGINIYPYGNFVIPIASIFFVNALLRHQLLGINLAFNRGLVYSLLIFMLSSMYLILVIILEKLLQHVFAYNSATISIMAAFFIGLFCFPLRARIQTLVDQLVFQKSPQEIAVENERLWAEIVKSERLKAAATLASGVAHEVKNPLTAIQTFTEYLPQKQDDPEFLAKFARIVGHEVGRINDLVQQLLDFARPEPLAIKPFQINTQIKDLLDMLGPRCINQHVRVRFDPAADPSLVLAADEAKICQALLNIILNAIDAMPSGGELTVSTRAVPADKGTAVLIRVKDSGAGIPPADRARIFEPFFSKKDNGTGLGLSITLGIIQEHNGTISIETAPGCGTTFIIQLPITAPGPAATPGQPPANHAQP